MAFTGDGKNFSTTFNMGLPRPVPGVCGPLGREPPGTSWLELINSAISTLDGHNHAGPGYGVPIPSAGIGINADLPFAGFNATGLRSTRFNSLSALSALSAADVGCLAVVGADLYYVDALGNQVRLTASGGIAGTPGSISGLASPAAVTYTPASKLFAFTSSSGVAANLSAGPISIGDATVSGGKAATIGVPSGLAANYNLTLPSALPASPALLSLSSAGALSSFGTVNGSSLTLSGALTIGGALAMSGALSGATTGAFSGALSVGGQISGVTDPTTAQQAATKNYVDASAQARVAKAWAFLSFNSSTTVAVLAGFNVASATGNFSSSRLTINLTNAMASASCAVLATPVSGAFGNPPLLQGLTSTASQVFVDLFNSTTGAATNYATGNQVFVVVFGN